MKNWSKILSLSFFILVSCEVFIPDPIDPRLPKYTVSGYNNAGAYINDSAWVSKWSEMIIVNPENSDSLIICMEGFMTGSRRVIQFDLINTDVRSYDDLPFLEGREIELDGISNRGSLGDGLRISPYGDGTGKLFIRNVRRISSGGFAFSGTFGFIIEDGPFGYTEVLSGRFDYEILELKKSK